MIGRITLRNGLGAFASTGLFQALSDTQPCILMYHCVGRGGYDHIDPSTFDSHVRWLKGAYDIVEVHHIQEAGQRKRVALTFDDGLLSFYEEVVPILERHGIPATVYVIGRTLGARRPDDDKVYMSHQQIRRLSSHPLVTIGSHTMTHPRLTSLNDLAQVRQEVVDAAALLRDITGNPIDGFCYPYNNWDDEVRDIVSSVHLHAVCEQGDFILIDESTSRFSLPRINAAIPLGRLRFRVSDTWKHYNRNTLRPSAPGPRRPTGGFGK